MAIPAIDYQLLANAGFPPASFKPGEPIFSEPAIRATRCM